MTDRAPEKPVRRWMRRARYVVLTALIVLPLIVLFQNLDTRADGRILFWPGSMPVMLLLAIAFLGGGTAGLWLGLALRKGKKR